jgi:hypothetical protein
MDTRQKLAALTAAVREGREIPAEVRLCNSITPLNNLNSSVDNNLNPTGKFKLQSEPENLNDLKRKGVQRLELYTDEAFKKALSWGVEEWLVQVCIRDYGIYTVKGQINRIHQIPEGYFKPHYGPVHTQRGRLFNTEMQRLKQSKAAKTGS